jgi:hypothetical protein
VTAFDYSRPTATANRLISRFGQAGYLRRTATSGTAYNPTQGSNTDHLVTFAVIEYEAREIDGARILATDKKVFLAKQSLAIEPLTSDKLLVGGVVHSIMDVKPLSPSGAVVLYELQVRR